MNLEEAIEFTLAALADQPSGPPAQEILAVIQAAAWDEGFEGAQGVYHDTNPYRSQE